MFAQQQTRHSIPLLLFIFYLAPLTILIFLNLIGLELEEWTQFILGTLLASAASILLFSYLTEWERGLQKAPSEEESPEPPPLQTPVDETEQELKTLLEKDQLAQLKEQLEMKNSEIQSLIASHNQYENEIQQTLFSLAKEKDLLDEQLHYKEKLLEGAEQKADELHATIERKQLRINELEGKVRDLSYEIKTLLKLTEEETSSSLKKFEIKATAQIDPPVEPISLVTAPIEPEESASLYLQKCINTAQKMTGGSHYSSGATRLRSFSADNYLLDLRCLFDTFRSEKSCAILFYSPKEEKILFANEQTKELTGWSPDKFVQNYDQIVPEGKDELKGGLLQLSSHPQAKIRLMVKTKTAEDRLIHGQMGLIPTGIFRNYVIIILYTASHQQLLSSTQ